jgi:hypothetical protein
LTARAPQSGDGGGALGQEDGEEAAGDRQADAFGTGARSEPCQQVGGADDGAAEVTLEPLQARLQVGDLLVQAGEPVL